MSQATTLSQRGATLIEVLVAIALTGIMLPALATALVTAKAGRSTTVRQLQASSLLREGQEAIRSVREKGWNNIATNGTYHPIISGSSWALASGSETINGYTRQIVISNTQRNVAGGIVNSGGTIDPSTKRITVTVSWSRPYNNSVSVDTYMSRWQNNALWTQTTQADFSGGTLTNTCATATCDQLSPPADAVQLQDSPATWQLPSLYGSFDISGNRSGTCVSKTTIGGVPYALIGTSAGLDVIDVSDPANPVLSDHLNTSGAVNGIAVSGNYAYLATAANNAEIVTVNISNPANISQADSLNLGDNGDAQTIAVSGSYAFVGKVAAGLFSQEFFVINVSNPANISQTGTLARQNATINGIYVSGNYAYLATSKTNSQFMVINITNKNSPSIADTLSAGAVGYDVAVSGTTAYLGTANNNGSGELRTINVTTPTNVSFIGSYEVGGQVNGIDIDQSNNSYLLLATAVANKQGIAVNVSTPSSPQLVSNINLGSTTNRVFIGGSFAYFGSTNTSQELQIVYAGYRPSGTFESSTFDAGASVGFNRLMYTQNVPIGSTLRLQVAANNTGSGWSYLGPDGTSGSYFTADGPIPLQAASGRYFRYKAYFTPSSNGQETPILNDVSVNYSP